MGDYGVTTCNLTSAEATYEKISLDLRLAEGEISGRCLFLASPARRGHWYEPFSGRKQ